MGIEYGHVVAATASLDLEHRSAGLQRAQPAKNAAVVDPHVRQYPGVRIQDPGPGTQRWRGSGWLPVS